MNCVLNTFAFFSSSKTSNTRYTRKEQSNLTTQSNVNSLESFPQLTLDQLNTCHYCCYPANDNSTNALNDILNMASSVTPGRVTIVLGNLLYAVGAFFFDYSETHVFNPRWPPHARFHNGQTMSLGALLAAASMYYLLRPTSSIAQAKDNVFTSTLIGSFYCTAGISAILYPGTAWQE